MQSAKRSQNRGKQSYKMHAAETTTQQSIITMSHYKYNMQNTHQNQVQYQHVALLEFDIALTLTLVLLPFSRSIRMCASDQFFLMSTKCVNNNVPLIFLITLLFTVLQVSVLLPGPVGAVVALPHRAGIYSLA